MTNDDLIKIAKIKAENLSVEYILGDIGVEEFYRGKKGNSRYKADYESIGKEVFYNKIVPLLKPVLCNKKKVKKEYKIDSDWAVIVIALLSEYQSGTIIAVLSILYKKGTSYICSIG